MPAAAERDFEKHLLTLGFDVTALAVDSSGTLAALTRRREDADVAPLSVAGKQDLEVGRVLGKGGMGVVRAAVQRALGREVAVKQLRPDLEDAQARAALIGEGKITGQLEHPNVVPIHRLTTDADGRPALVMKLIDGSLWSDYLADDDLVLRDHASARDPLELHIDVMMSVCNALEFAHDRGVVHRDIKPANVMIGRFGEVYLLDWGLAVGTHEDGPEHLPLAREICEPAGSPGYMAPEMAAGAGELVSERTDVYLLGAVLHQVLTGHPPHVGKTLLDVLQSAFRATPPELGDDVPSELAAICRRALAFDPEERFESVRTFRDALARFLRHRAAHELSIEADRKAAQFESARKEGDASVMQRSLTEARFAYQLALRDWPDNAAARSGHDEVLRHLVRAEIERGHPAAARQLLDELGEVDDELDAAVTQLEEAQEAERRRVSQLEREYHEADIRVRERSRTVQLLKIGAFVVSVVAVQAIMRLTGVYEATPFTAFLTMGAITIASYWWSARQTEFNDANKRARGAFASALIVGTAYLGFATLIDQDLTLALAILMFFLSGGCAVGTGLLHPSGIFAAGVFFAMGAALLVYPDYRSLIMPLGLLAAFAALVYTSRRASDARKGASPPEEEPPPR